jgi:Cu+-exporting ATPase
MSPDDGVLALAASAQQGSEHPLAKAIVDAAHSRGLALSEVSELVAHPGRGALARTGGRLVCVGSDRFLQEQGLDTASGRAIAEAESSVGRSLVWIAELLPRPGLVGLISLGDAPRQSAKLAVERLHRLGVRTVLLSGDNARAANAVGEALGIQRVVAEVLPEDKAREVERLRADSDVVAMVGDGINDAPALAAADIGIAMGTGTDVAMHTAGVTLMRAEPVLVAEAIAVSRATYRKIWQNLFWAFIYNVIGIPLAAAGALSPVLAGAAMAASSVSVVSSSLLLKRWKPLG